MEQHEERFWEAEVYRLRGVLLLRQTGTPQAEAETWLQRALDVARRQEAKSLELRAAMSLARLWQQQGKRAEALRCWPLYMAGSPKDSTPLTSRRPGRCLMLLPEGSAEDIAQASRPLRSGLEPALPGNRTLAQSL